MTWYLLAHVLYKIYEKGKREKLSIKELEELLLHTLWSEYRFTIYENELQLREDLKLLQAFKFIEFNEGIVKLNVDKLRKFEYDVVRKDPILQKSTTYLLAFLRERIDKTIENHFQKRGVGVDHE
jgi:hypothetical protein